ncbi:hypothetical protein N7488_006866 [Penicillium malachiteum]|nr:hypothetical protein N7488_006866 [Penicillium malachiteum]
MLTVIDLMVRVEKKLPVLQMRSEAYHYNVINKCQCGMKGDWYSYYMSHELCLWEVTKEEIVGTWAWEDFWKYPDWYEEVILPAYRAHSEEARMGREREMQSRRRLDALEFGEAWPIIDECSSSEEVEDAVSRVSRHFNESSLRGELAESLETGGTRSSEEERSWYELNWDSDDVYENGEVEQGRSSVEDVKSEVGGVGDHGMIRYTSSRSA